MEALVTGGTGFIGSHLIEELINEGFSVSSLVRSTSDLKWIEGYPVKIIEGDCLNIESLKDTIRGYDYIFHLAGITKADNKEDFYYTNVQGTENILNIVHQHNRKLKRFVYLSSLAVTGPSKNGTPVDTSFTPEPVSDYGKSKLRGEESVLRYKDYLPITIIRPPAVYGPRDKD